MSFGPLTKEEALRIAASIPTEVGDLISCWHCGLMHDAELGSNGHDGRLIMRCGDKVIPLDE